MSLYKTYRATVVSLIRAAWFFALVWLVAWLAKLAWRQVTG